MKKIKINKLGYCESIFDWFRMNSGTYMEVYGPQKSEIFKEPKSLNPEKNWYLTFYNQLCSNSCFLFFIQGGIIYTNRSIVLTPDGFILREFMETFEPGNSLYPKIIKIKHKASRMACTKKKIAVLSVHDAGYYHWLFDVLPRIHLISKKELLNSVDFFFVEKLHKEYQKETLKILGIPYEKIITDNNYSLIKSQELLVPSIPRDLPDWIIRFLKKNFLPVKRKTHLCYEKVYISREDANSRTITNNKEVENLLNSYGFQKICLSNMSIPEQVTIFNSAKVIVAPHGAGLSNLVFCKSGTKIIEIFSPNYIAPYYWRLSARLNLDYYYLLGEGEIQDKTKDFYSLNNDLEDEFRSENITVNVQKLEDTLHLANIKKD